MHLTFVSFFVYDRTDLERKWLARLKYTPNKACFKCYSSYQGEDVEEHRKSYNVILRSRGFLVLYYGCRLARWHVSEWPFRSLGSSFSVCRETCSSSFFVFFRYAKFFCSSEFEFYSDSKCSTMCKGVD